ncbi:MAG: bifunctional 5,10-methylenetetrahydrofolate dehydrogenase/5,10-methenyltetrahydrofolate cyclohydrolase [Candidatus Wallbacteria bacterium]|nr:bifunctional 5,10-methylenetetrahydrofolate dehydrogenase/5,10-methenyltetrahydrofolate cyclohydrolase [Candidatus Wallbacteria bacterium]
MSKIIDCKAIAAEIIAETDELRKSLQTVPSVVVYLLSTDEASANYAKNIEKDGKKLNFEVRIRSEKPDSFRASFDHANHDHETHCIMIQYPLPQEYDSAKILSALDPKKDIDGLSDGNSLALYQGRTGLFPSTPQAVLEILRRVIKDPEGESVTVIGRSRIVGLPLFHLLLSHNFTPTVCHSRTKNLPDLCKKSRIIVAAVGKARMIDERFLSAEQVLIDVGTNFREGQWVGDFDFEQCLPACRLITPVPSGVGTVTRAVLYRNIVKAALWQKNLI